MASVFSETDPIAEAEDLIAQGKAGAAAEQLRARLKAGRGGLLARLTLVKALLAAGDADGALEEARETASLNPPVAMAALGLGEALLAKSALPAAIAELQRALRLDPTLERARLLTGKAWLEAGEAAHALAIFEKLEPSPEMEILIARAKAIGAASRSDAGYVRHLFDQFSADYDHRMLGQLDYAAPQLLKDLADLVMPGREGLAVLDLGCGTGLAGLLFKPRATRLAGIDLSPAMIEKARARGVYDSLAVGDIETALEGQYDLILAADTLVYLGDLKPLFIAVAKHLRTGGFFLFTTEAKEGTGFELGPKRRWRHSEAYLRALAKEVELFVAGLVSASPRTESHQPVPGFAAALHKRFV
ncbi:MAG TPA: methyltransferase domain-containing protein [Rhizomicrobium sp.]|nr:methyltransferase domain-containing protein [Rhizomicrobium sp.]